MAHSSGGFFMLQSDDSNVSGLTVESCSRSEFETFLELPHCLPGDGGDKGPHMGLQEEDSYRGQQDEGPYRRRQSEEPYRGLQDERPYRGLQDEGPYRGQQDEGPYRRRQSEEPYRGLQDERPYRGLQDEGPYRGQQDEGPYRRQKDEGPYRRQQDEGSYRRQRDHFPVRDWDPNLPLRNLPLSMQEKRKTRDRRQQQRLSIGCWESWRQSQRTARRRLREKVVRTMFGLQPWRKALHTIEGKFGVGVKAYFTFLRYLLYLNLIHCLFISGLALTPVLLYGKHNLTQGFTGNDSVLDLFFLTGFVDRSPVFYRFYSPVDLYNVTLQEFGSQPCLSSTLLFLLAIASLLTLSIIMVVRRTVIGYKHSWMLGSRYNLHFSYKVFCGWDFCTQVPESAVLQHSFIRNDIKLVLEEERFHQRVSQRTFRQWVQLYFLRGVLNFLVIVLLGASFYLIYQATKFSPAEKCNSPMLSLLVEYLPSITITMVNFLLPHLFRRISGFEDYSLTVQVNITLVRSIILKLACLAIFLYFLLHQPRIRSAHVNPLAQDNCPVHFSALNYSESQCWENQFGKEMYKLVVFDFLACCLNAVLVEWPRKLLVERYPSSSFLRALGKPTFLVPFHVLDLVYSQTVTWVGLFYCPLLAHISLLKLLFVFYIKKFVLFRCCEPAQKMFRGSQSSVLFHFTLLLGLLLAVVALGINANTYPPSSDCGPFAGNRTLFKMMDTCVGILPVSGQKALRFFISEAFAPLLILVEIVFLTSFVSQGRANRRAIEGLKDILVMCSADKRFLVKKHSAWLRTLKTSLSAGNSEDVCRTEAVDPSEIQPPFTRSTSAPCGGVAS